MHERDHDPHHRRIRERESDSAAEVRVGTFQMRLETQPAALSRHRRLGRHVVYPQPRSPPVKQVDLLGQRESLAAKAVGHHLASPVDCHPSKVNALASRTRVVWHYPPLRGQVLDATRLIPLARQNFGNSKSFRETVKWG